MYYKKTFYCLLIFLILGEIYSGSVNEIDDKIFNSKYNNEDYLNFYKIPSSIIRFSNNGGNSAVFRKIEFAFDEDFSTYWISEKENTILNNIIITFSKTVKINRMLYQAPIVSSQAGYGYPSELKIYYKLKNTKGLLTDDFLLLDDIISSPTSNVVVFEFSIIICDQIKFEWANIQVGNYAAKEIKLFFPENK